MILEKKDLKYRISKSDEKYKERISEFRRVANTILQLHAFPNAMLAGGSVMKMFINMENTADWDVFFTDKEAYEEYLDFAKGLLKEEDEPKITPYSTTLYVRGEKLQLINYRYFDGWEELFDSFDLNVCMFGFDAANDKIVHPEDVLKEAYSKQIKFHTIHAPTNTMMHLQRYIQYGFKVKRSEMRNLVMRIAASIDSDPDWDKNISI